MARKLERKIAVITGGTSGIGLATAKRFTAEGARVFVTGRRQVELDAAVAAIGPRATGIQADSANLTDLNRLYARVKADAGRIDVLLVNAGGGTMLPLGDDPLRQPTRPLITPIHPASHRSSLRSTSQLLRAASGIGQPRATSLAMP